MRTSETWTLETFPKSRATVTWPTPTFLHKLHIALYIDFPRLQHEYPYSYCPNLTFSFLQCCEKVIKWVFWLLCDLYLLSLCPKFASILLVFSAWTLRVVEFCKVEVGRWQGENFGSLGLQKVEICVFCGSFLVSFFLLVIPAEIKKNAM